MKKIFPIGFIIYVVLLTHVKGANVICHLHFHWVDIMCIDHQGFNGILVPSLVEEKQAWLLRCAIISADLIQKNKTSSNQN